MSHDPRCVERGARSRSHPIREPPHPGAGILPNTVENVAAWIKDPPAIKPDAKMPALGLTDEQARAVATYLIGLK